MATLLDWLWLGPVIDAFLLLILPFLIKPTEDAPARCLKTGELFF